jgi:hypothetical protein
MTLKRFWQGSEPYCVHGETKPTLTEMIKSAAATRRNTPTHVRTRNATRDQIKRGLEAKYAATAGITKSTTMPTRACIADV